MTIMQTGVPPLFGELSREQAKRYLAQFMDEMRASRERLAGMLAGAGADPSLADDPSPSALEPIWSTATEAWDLSWQADYVPPPDTAHPAVSRPTMKALGPLENLPSWFGHDRIHDMRFSPATLWVIDVLGRHLGQCLIEARPQLAWTLGPSRPANNIDRNKPVVGTTSTWVSPLRAVSGLAYTAITGVTYPGKARTLREYFDETTSLVDRW